MGDDESCVKIFYLQMAAKLLISYRVLFLVPLYPERNFEYVLNTW